MWDLFFPSVESSDISWRRKKSGGIKIICQSDMRDFSAMAFITDHVHSLIEQWFPGQCTAPWTTLINLISLIRAEILTSSEARVKTCGPLNHLSSDASKPKFRNFLSVC